ncbi:uncharacterized protein N7473_007584 [Penicillium subrubescens]|uniref:uncharacterized protein n=1 Tax=Penicillium subrubescens TaxID=1316194 RepID=UPI002545164A|nr:uncharacterized protein N7473_007584 [Penicillium subrubescens]KAJ5891356.1 hypothetical protein N7473_007584 [Penicillium subrubescens]
MRRRPINCQPCRVRKIRCSRDGRPCQACKHRGLGAEDCIYLAQPRLAPKQSPSPSHVFQMKLLSRIQDLETQLQEQADSHASSVLNSAIFPPIAPESSAASSFLIPERNFLSTRNSAGALHTAQSGYVRYISLTAWESIVANSPATEHLQSFILDIDVEDDPPLSLIWNGEAPRSELLGLLPPVLYCDTLKDLYFRVISPTFHILHEMTFNAEYQLFSSDHQTASPSWLALLFAILATSLSAMDDADTLLSDLGRESTVSRNKKVLFARYRSAALRCLAMDRIMTRHTVNSLQALVLINFACLHRGLFCSALTGLTYHVAISMGCHIHPERFLLSPIECEERRRVWAGLMIVKTVQNNLFGILTPQNCTKDMILPADMDDADLFTTTSIPLSSDGFFSPCNAPLTQMTYLFLACHLNRMSDRICEFVFSSMRSRYCLATLEAELEAVRDHCDARYTQEYLPVHHHANKKTLQAQIQQQLLLLHRPTLIRFLCGEKNPETYAAREKCIASANTALSIFFDLVGDPQFIPHMWWTSGLGSFYAFHALIVLSVLLHHSDSASEFDRTKEVVIKGRGIFATLSVRSIFCSKAVPILTRIMFVFTFSCSCFFPLTSM